MGSRVNSFLTTLRKLSDGRYHYYDGRAGGIGCSDFVWTALIESGIVSASDEKFHAASGKLGVLKDPTKFKRVEWSPKNLKAGIIMWSNGHHVSVWAGDRGGSVYEAAPESTHSRATCGTGVGLHYGHGYYNCGTGDYNWTCLYEIVEPSEVTKTAKEIINISMDKSFNIEKIVEFLPVIQSGSSGNMVKALQAIMKRYGWYDDVIDGSAGPNTAKGLKLLQTAIGVTPDGSFGPKSWAKLLG